MILHFVGTISHRLKIPCHLHVCTKISCYQQQKGCRRSKLFESSSSLPWPFVASRPCSKSKSASAVKSCHEKRSFNYVVKSIYLGLFNKHCISSSNYMCLRHTSWEQLEHCRRPQSRCRISFSRPIVEAGTHSSAPHQPTLYLSFTNNGHARSTQNNLKIMDSRQ